MNGLEMLLAGKKITTKDQKDYWYLKDNTIYYHKNGIFTTAIESVNYFLRNDIWVEYDECILLSNADKNKFYVDAKNSNYSYSYCLGFGYWIQCGFGQYYRVFDPDCIKVRETL